MFILLELLNELQEQFTNTELGRKRKVWFVYTLLAVIVPFTSSMTSNLLRSLDTLFGLKIKKQRFYAFMASPTLPWRKLWRAMWSLIPDPLTDGRIITALDDSINPKCGKNIFGCGNFHDHAAKKGQSKYPWSQCIVALGLLKKVKSRWACLPLGYRLYMMKKMIKSGCINVLHKGEPVRFQSKMEQAADMIREVQEYFEEKVLVTTDSWFGNNGLWSRLDQGCEGVIDLLSRMRSNIVLYDFPTYSMGKRPQGRPRKYGTRLGRVDECAGWFRDKAQEYSVYLYGKQREVLAYSQDVMLKTMKCPVRVVWVYRKTRYVSLMTTDLTLTVEQIIEYYGARWKIESGFKEIKQEIGSSKSQVRNADAVMNHLHFCMMAATLTWIYADRLPKAPTRRHKVSGRTSFAFSDVRRDITEVALSSDFRAVCPLPVQTPLKSFVKTLLRMVA
ncbi:MAG TPA: IS701 family transposase [Desulfobulbus sp.]|nr:IS701 family transposase [Desulfobulbus sp.]